MLHRIKKHNDINEGKWIGVGGHAEGQESPEECLLREVKEETGLTLTSYKLRGLVTFISDKCEPELMCVFTANEYIGELTECNEGELYWIDKAVVPTLPTWEGDRVFLDLLLSGDERFFSLKLQKLRFFAYTMNQIRNCPDFCASINLIGSVFGECTTVNC